MTVNPTVLVWQDREYNLDALDLTMGEYETIARVTEPPIDGYQALHGGLRSMDFRAWKALFFVQDLRREPGLRWSAYEGPTYRVIFAHFDSLPDDGDDDRADDGEPAAAVEPAPEGKG